MIWIQGPGGSNARNGCGVNHLTLICDAGQSGVTGIQCDSTYSCLIDDVYVVGVYAINIFMNGTGSIFGAYNIIRDCHLGPAGSGNTSGGIGIVTAFSEYLTVRGGIINWFNQTGGIGTKITNGNCTLDSVQFDVCDTSTVFDFVDIGNVVNCEFDRGYSTYLSIHGSRLIRIANNFFGGFSGSGSKPAIDMGAGSQSHDNLVIGNYFPDSGTPWAYWVYESGMLSTQYNYYLANNIPGSWAINRVSGIFRQNVGYNSLGHLTSPSIPASTTAYTNNFGVDCMVVVSGGTVTAIAVGGTATGLTSGSFRVPALQTITLTYSSAPSWNWYGD